MIIFVPLQPSLTQDVPATDEDNNYFFTTIAMRRRVVANAAEANGEPTALAGDGDVCLHPLFAEHLHRPGVGLRQRGPETVQPLQSRLPSVGPSVQAGGHAGHNLHGEASLRFLHVAFKIHRVFGEELPLEERQGRRGARTG